MQDKFIGLNLRDHQPKISDPGENGVCNDTSFQTANKDSLVDRTNVTKEHVTTYKGGKGESENMRKG